MKNYKKSIIVLSGLPLVGKTKLGEVIHAESNYQFLDVESARKQVEGSGAWLGSEQEKEIMHSAYVLNHELAKQRLLAGQPVLLCATYSRPEYHEMLNGLQTKTRVPLRVFLLTCPHENLFQRIQKRSKDNPSNIRTLEQIQTVIDRFIPYPALTATIDTSDSIEYCVSIIFRALSDLQKTGDFSLLETSKQ